MVAKEIIIDVDLYEKADEFDALKERYIKAYSKLSLDELIALEFKLTAKILALEALISDEFS